jgi:hypothetical protein
LSIEGRRHRFARRREVTADPQVRPTTPGGAALLRRPIFQSSNSEIEHSRAPKYLPIPNAPQYANSTISSAGPGAFVKSEGDWNLATSEGRRHRFARRREVTADPQVRPTTPGRAVLPRRPIFQSSPSEIEQSRSAIEIRHL